MNDPILIPTNSYQTPSLFLRKRPRFLLLNFTLFKFEKIAPHDMATGKKKNASR